jgi:hypothetical protein
MRDPISRPPIKIWCGILHRVRALLIRERTALMNQMRGLLAECGIVLAPGAAHLRRALAEIRGTDDDQISEVLHRRLVEMSGPAASVRAATCRIRSAKHMSGTTLRSCRPINGGARRGTIHRSSADSRGRRRTAV